MTTKYLLAVKADTNDGDYITKTTFVEQDDISTIKKIATAISKQKGYNWVKGDLKGPNELEPYELYKNILTEEEIDYFGGVVPHGEHGIHTIESIIIHKVVETTKLL